MSTITTLNQTDSGSVSRGVINTNFTNLNTDKVEATGAVTLTNKTIALGANTVSGTTAQFNTALSDNDFATLAGAEALTNKTLTSPTISSPTFSTTVGFGANTAHFTAQAATGDGTTTINWGLGNKFNFTFGAFNETFTFTAPSGSCSLILWMKQDGTGSRTATWPATVQWPAGTAPTLTTTLDKVDIITFYYNATTGTYYGNSSLNFTA